MRLLPALLAAFVASGCAHMATLRPSPKGELTADLEIGGPMLKLGGAPIPAPLSAVGVRYGVHERADVQVHFHPTAAVFGVLGLDVGSSLWAIKGSGAIPDVTATGRFYGFSDFKEFRAYVQLGAVASWRIADHIAPYLGFDGLIQFGAVPLASAAAGVQGIFGRFTAQLEARWFGIGNDTRTMAVDWVSPGTGAIGIMFGFGYRFDVDKPAPPPPAPAPAPAKPAEPAAAPAPEKLPEAAPTSPPPGSEAAPVTP